ncbi:hypothetical protein BH09PSE4_BH09PSE4_15790 [soil metagenome]
MTGRKAALAAGLMASTLAGCTTTYEFAPPLVDTAHPISSTSSINARCTTSGSGTIERNVEGALDLIRNFEASYHCAVRDVANGRRDFEIPSILAIIGGTAAAALGAPTSVAIGTGVAVSLMNTGKSYFAPKDKLPILQAAHNAILCIKDEAVGIPSPAFAVVDAAAAKDLNDQSLSDTAGQASGGSVAILATRQYFEMVESSLKKVDAIAGQRLSSVGSYNPDAIVSDLQAIAAKKDKPPTAADLATTSAAADTIVTTAATDDENDAMTLTGTPTAAEIAAQAAAQAVMAARKQAVQELLLNLMELQPKLQGCVVSAKL